MKHNSTTLEDKLDTAIGLLQHLVAIELAREGVPQQAIARHLRASTARINKMLKGTKRRGQQQ